MNKKFKIENLGDFKKRDEIFPYQIRNVDMTFSSFEEIDNWCEEKFHLDYISYKELGPLVSISYHSLPVRASFYFKNKDDMTWFYFVWKHLLKEIN